MEEAKALLRTAVRTFHKEPIQALLLDALLYHTVLHLDDFNALTTISQKELRGLLQPLRTSRFLHIGSRREHHVLSQRDATREYYYVVFSDAVNVIKYRVNKLRTEISNQYLTASGPDTFLCPRCKRTWKELDIHATPDGGLPCPKCDFPDVILNDAAFQNQGAHENIQKLNSQLTKYQTLIAQIDAKLASGQFKDLTFDEAFKRRKLIPQDQGGKHHQWADVKRGRERDTAAGAIDEDALSLKITNVAALAKEEAEREAERKARIKEANLKPAWHTEGVVKGGTLDIRGDDTDVKAGPSSALKKEEEDEKKPDLLKDTGKGLAEREDAQQAMMEQYMLDMQREQEEAERRKREQEEDGEDGDEDDDEEDEFEDVPGTGTPALDTPMSSQGIAAKPTVPAVNGLKREYEDDSSEAATPASDDRDRDRDGKRLKLDGAGTTNGTPTPGAIASRPAAPGADDDSDDEEFEDV